MTRLWALVVGIEKYDNPEWDEVWGAKNDVRRVHDYLIKDLKVPSSNIIALVNKDATRRNIITSFRNHLIDNTQIQPGDALYFHFSGHGSRSPAPRNWPIIEKVDEDDEENGLLEMIIPWDEGMVDPKNPHNRVCGIPDRTLGALLAKAARRYGENITVVLDCCHSGHGTRGLAIEAPPFKARAIPKDKVVPLREDVDREIWGRSDSIESMTGEQKLRASFTQRSAKSHVLMAACGRDEQAVGNGSGGILTTYWLKALRSKMVHPRTYAELMKHVNRDIETLRKQHPAYVSQHPQCEGVTRDRLVFQDAIADSQFFRAFPLKGSLCRINAGEVHGVTPDASFELYDMGDDLRPARTLGTAIARNVFPTYCDAELANGVRLTAHNHSAMLQQPRYLLKYAIVNMAPNDAITHQLLGYITRSLDGRTVPVNAVCVQPGPDVDLIMEVDARSGGGVTLRRRDVNLRDIRTPHPRLTAEDVQYASFPEILNGIARFNFFLTQTSKFHPHAGNVDLEFWSLQEDNSNGFYDDTNVDEARKLKKPILFKNDEATINQTDEEYAFVLRNHGFIPLYPYLVYFDTRTYEIAVWYAPFEEDRPTLLPRRTLQIGASPEHSTPFSFFLPGDSKADTSIIKIFLLDEPTQMSFMDQPPLVGLDEDGRSYVTQRSRGIRRSPAASSPPRKGGWDTISRRVTVVQ